MSDIAVKNKYSSIRLWSIILLFIVIMPNTILAQDLLNPIKPKKETFIVLSAPDKIQKFLEKYLRFPTKAFTDNAEKNAYLYRAQKEIRSLLATEGYFSPIISWSHQSEKEALKPEIKIDPGKLTRVGEITITFQGEITQTNEQFHQRIKQLRDSWLMPENSPFRSAEWEQAKTALLSSVTGEQFAAATIIASKAKIDAEHARVDLTITIDSGPIFYFGEIQIEGLERYDRKLVTNLALFKAGDVYRRESLHLFQIALQKTPQFNTISVSTSADISQHKAIPIQVALTEAHAQRFAFGVGYSSNNGARGEINYRNHNFLSRAWNMNSMLRLEQKRQTFFAGIDTLPNEKNVNYSLGASLQMTDIQNLKTIEQKVGINRNHYTPNEQFQFGLNWLRENKKPAGANNQINEVVTLDLRWRRQIVDDPLHIRRGDVTEIRIGGGTKFLLSDQDFIRTHIRQQSWWPIGSRDVFFIRGEIGYTLASSRFGIPQEYLFRAGGIQSIRGYDFKSIGVQEGDAIVGGRTMATATAEYTHWLTHQWGAAVFTDVGSAADNWQKMHMFLGYGAGVRWRSPAGPIAIDLARSHETGTLRMHFSLSVAF